MKWRSHEAAVTVVTVSAPSLFFTGFDNQALTPQTLVPVGGTAPYSFVGVGLPAGVTVGAGTGTISGTPTSSGNTSASVTVTDSAAHTASIPVFFAIDIGTFSDTLLRVAGAQLGNPWVLGYSNPSQAGWYNTTGGIACNNVVGLTIQNPTGGGASISMPFVPAISTLWNGQTQFAELKITASAGVAGVDMGPAVALTNDSSTGTANGYFASIEFAGGNGVALIVANFGERLITGFVTTWAINDVIRISVQFAPTQNTVILTKNGTTISTVIDNNAARPLATNGGVPGIFCKGAATLNSLSFENFRCGLGLG